MEGLLRGLTDLAGVRGAFVMELSGELRYHQAHAIYDEALLTEVGQTLIQAVESLELQHGDWTSFDVEFADGRVLVGRADRLLVVLLAGEDLNTSFANVAMRVALGKIKKAIASGGLDASGLSVGASSAAPVMFPQMGQTQPPPMPPPLPPPLPHAMSGSAGLDSAIANLSLNNSILGASGLGAGSGLTWTGSNPNASGMFGTSGPGGSGVAVADSQSNDALTRCSRALARAVGPMAKVFVKEGVRRIAQGAPFTLRMLPALVADLEQQISDTDDRNEFRKSALQSGK